VVTGALPASVVWHDDVVVVCMDHEPVTRGHMLVVPRVHTAGLGDTPSTTLARMAVVAQRMAGALRSSGLRCEGTTLYLADGAAAFQEVFHVHLHVFARYRDDGFTLNARWVVQPRDELDATAGLLRTALGGYRSLPE